MIAVRRRRCCAARPTVSPERRCAVSWRLLGGAHKHTTGRRFYLFSSANKFQSSSFIDNNPRWTVGVCKIDPTVKSSPPQQSNSWASGREQVSPLRYCQTPTPPLAWCLLSRRVSPSSANNGPRLTRVECVVVVCIRVSVSVCAPRERLVTRALFNRTERERVRWIDHRTRKDQKGAISQTGGRERHRTLWRSQKTPKAIDTSSKTSCTTDCENADRNASAAIAARRKRVVRAIDPHQSLPFPSPPALPPSPFHPSIQPTGLLCYGAAERATRPASHHRRVKEKNKNRPRRGWQRTKA